ncbi:hypothetical protein CKA32_004252 [Geitlerinema sp. FC II]|nr:hypothetical protein CKA32_004252 [Geitlerinema sp. FC II]
MWVRGLPYPLTPTPDGSISICVRYFLTIARSHRSVGSQSLRNSPISPGQDRETARIRSRTPTV